MKATNTQCFRGARRWGTPLAVLRSVALISVLGSFSMSCLVTEQVRFEERRGPLTVTRVAPAVLSTQPNAGTTPCTVGSGEGVTFTVRIADPTFTERPEVLWYVDGGTPIRAIQDSILRTDATDEELGSEVWLASFCFERDNDDWSDLAVTCARVEALVARSFLRAEPPVAAEGESFTPVQWFLGSPVEDAVIERCVVRPSVLDDLDEAESEP